MNVEIAAGIAPGSVVRVSILRFLPAVETVEASKLSDEWWDAAASIEVWRPKFLRSLSTHLQLIDVQSLAFKSPMMYKLSLDACEPQRMSGLDSEYPFSLDKFHTSHFLSAAAALYGEVTGSRAAKCQFPIACVLLNSASFLRFLLSDSGIQLPESVGSFFCDSQYPDLTQQMHNDRVKLLLVHVCRLHLIAPRLANVPWLISYFHWATTLPQNIPFNKIFLYPAIVLLKRWEFVPLPLHAACRLLDLCVAMLHRFMPTEFVLPSDPNVDPRCIVSLMFKVLEFANANNNVDEAAPSMLLQHVIDGVRPFHSDWIQREVVEVLVQRTARSVLHLAIQKATENLEASRVELSTTTDSTDSGNISL